MSKMSFVLPRAMWKEIETSARVEAWLKAELGWPDGYRLKQLTLNADGDHEVIVTDEVHVPLANPEE